MALFPSAKDYVEKNEKRDSSILLTILNGEYCPELSNLDNEEKQKIEIASLLDFSSEKSKGICVKTSENAHIAAPIKILKLHTKNNNPTLDYKIIINIAQNTQACIVEKSACLSDVECSNNIISEINLANDSFMEHLIINDESAHSTTSHNYTVNLADNCSYNNYNFSFAYKSLQNHLNILLKGNHANANLVGLCIEKNEQSVDNYIELNHVGSNCSSSTNYKNLVDDQSKSNFTGKIFIKKDSTDNNANLNNHNLLLSSQAKAYSKPQLEIFSDDVKCCHGASFGYIDESALFYLKSRGLSEINAKNILKAAFCLEQIEMIKNKSINKNIEKLIMEKIQ